MTLQAAPTLRVIVVGAFLCLPGPVMATEETPPAPAAREEAGPSPEERRETGVYVTLYLLVFIGLAYLTQRAIWKGVPRPR